MDGEIIYQYFRTTSSRGHLTKGNIIKSSILSQALDLGIRQLQWVWWAGCPIPDFYLQLFEPKPAASSLSPSILFCQISENKTFLIMYEN